MNHKDYLSELLSIQCEQAYGTVQRLKRMDGLTEDERNFLEGANNILAAVRDKFRVVKIANTEADDGKEGQA